MEIHFFPWLTCLFLLSSVPRVPGLTYLDKGKDPKNPETKVETRDAITFGSYVDSVYLNAPNHVALEVGRGQQGGRAGGLGGRSAAWGAGLEGGSAAGGQSFPHNVLLSLLFMSVVHNRTGWHWSGRGHQL